MNRNERRNEFVSISETYETADTTQVQITNLIDCKACITLQTSCLVECEQLIPLLVVQSVLGTLMNMNFILVSNRNITSIAFLSQT